MFLGGWAVAAVSAPFIMTEIVTGYMGPSSLTLAVVTGLGLVSGFLYSSTKPILNGIEYSYTKEILNIKNKSEISCVSRRFLSIKLVQRHFTYCRNI